MSDLRLAIIYDAYQDALWRVKCLNTIKHLPEFTCAYWTAAEAVIQYGAVLRDICHRIANPPIDENGEYIT